MNDLAHVPQATMSSREISELTGRRHDNVMRVCRDLKAAGVTPQIEEFPFTHNGNTYEEFHLNKRDSLVLVARLSPEFTGRIVDRWLELEGRATQGSFHVPQSMSAALRLAADQQEQLEAQQKQLEAAKPAVEFVERYVKADSGNKGFRQVCKLLNANEFEFRQFLADKKIMYRLGGEWTPYEHHCNLGRFVVKAGVSSVNGHAFNHGVFTAKGVNWIAGLWTIHKLGLQA